MGKRKSKACKQKQAKAKSRTHKRKQGLLSKFNIPVSKDGEVVQTKQAGEKVHTKKSKVDGGASKSTPKKIMTKKLRRSAHTATPASKGHGDQDFEDEFKSLQERQYHAQLKKGRSKNAPLQMAPATLQLDQKPTTDQLISEAATHFDGMNELGSANANMITSTPGGNSYSNLLQALAARKRQEHTMEQQRKQASHNIGQGNNFWELRDDSDEDEKKDAVRSFNFAAASFVVPTPLSSVTNGAANTRAFGDGIDSDDDPDL